MVDVHFFVGCSLLYVGMLCYVCCVACVCFLVGGQIF